MNKIILLSAIIPIMCAYSQVKDLGPREFFKQGNWECNLSTNLGIGFSTSSVIYSTQSTYLYDTSYYEYTRNYNDRTFNLLFTASIGYCVLDGLAIEPEFDVNLITDAEISISLIGNLCYSFHIPRKNIYPFIKLGYGLSNYLSDNHNVSYDESNNNSLDTRVINAGIGLNFVYSSNTALKMEINYKNFSYSVSSTYGDQNHNKSSTNIDTDVNALTISTGLSILF